MLKWVRFKIMDMNKLYIFVFIFLLISCNEEKEVSSINPVNWAERETSINQKDSLVSGKSYLSVYSEIYSLSEHKTHDLTATISMRNNSTDDSIYITKADYYNTKGDLLRSYLSHPIYIAPMETVEIVIDQKDREGGTGANFLFYWRIPESANMPLFEGVMISTSGQQGLSFSTQALRID